VVFSDTVTNLGIVQQVRSFMRVDATQWPTSKIVNSVNNYLDTVAGYAIGADRRFEWDDTNHTRLPEGTTDLVANQSDYSFLTDQQGNRILTVTRIDMKLPSGIWQELVKIDQKEIPMALDQFNNAAGIPTYYDLIADNIVRLYPKSATAVTAGLKFYFQRTPSYFTASDTTKEPGVANTLHRGFIINAAYDGAMTLGLQNLNALAGERAYEEVKMKEYFEIRNVDDYKSIRGVYRSSR
jgi:hypothetical protein